MNYGTQPTKAQIEAARGHFCIKREPPYPDPVRKPLPPLGVAEKAKVEANRAKVHLHMPDMEPFIKELYEAGMINGWRSVGEVVLIDVEGQNSPATMITLEGNKHGNA